ncbi:hypothetical protein GR160_02925 [Flavobacterium sp. Sd200]|uniref:hypothetical protein n=1 Tax=Flavobacterium sp. Sd200 TaxID=2692211 RepID=UPI00136B31F4|nr:hypothetical protein [Flavobacterium sp. Sd200]MXN90167.1 hypothetical protein [Flavobacterium sp. Sd200]
MLDTYLPTVDLNFITENLTKCNKIIEDSRFDVGPNMTTFVLKGTKPMHKRHVIITHEDGVVNYNQASAHAINYQFMGALLDWLLVNKGWKEGAYVETDALEVNNNDME